MPHRDPKFSEPQLRQICAILGDTSDGLTGSEIDELLASRFIENPVEEGTKRHRLFVALSEAQQHRGCGNPVLSLVAAAMAPVRYTNNRGLFEHRRDQLNVVLSFYGLRIRDDGKFGRLDPATTLSEAAGRVNRLRAELERRGVHPDVMYFCQLELLQENCFHAVFEATKSVAEKLRRRTGLNTDGADLVDTALSGLSPILRINTFASPTETSEQKGFANLVKGLFGTFRNVTAHAPRVMWPITEEDALDLFSLASYVHRRLDRATLHM